MSEDANIEHIVRQTLRRLLADAAAHKGKHLRDLGDAVRTEMGRTQSAETFEREQVGLSRRWKQDPAYPNWCKSRRLWLLEEMSRITEEMRELDTEAMR